MVPSPLVVRRVTAAEPRQARGDPCDAKQRRSRCGFNLSVPTVQRIFAFTALRGLGAQAIASTVGQLGDSARTSEFGCPEALMHPASNFAQSFGGRNGHISPSKLRSTCATREAKKSDDVADSRSASPPTDRLTTTQLLCHRRVAGLEPSKSPPLPCVPSRVLPRERHR